MLTETFFNKTFNALLTFKDIPVDKVKSDKFYQLMKNDFTDQEFGAICGDICKTEKLYNRYPDPCLFYQRKPKPNAETVLEVDKQNFLDKCADYLTSGFITTDERKEFNESLTDIERRVLRRFGSISDLWTACNRENCPRSIDSVLKELKTDFENAWTAGATGNGVLRLTYGISGKNTISVIDDVKQQLLSHWRA